MFTYPLRPNEKLVQLYRQTEWVLVKPLLIILVGIYLPWYFLLKYEMADTYMRLLLFWSLILFAYGVIKYLLWLLNVNIVTDKRLIQVKYQTIFNKKFSENELSNIVNATVHTPGLIASMLNFGNVEIQIANVHDPVIFARVREPKLVKDLIWANKKA